MQNDLPELPPLPSLPASKPKKHDGIDSSSGLSFIESLSFNGFSNQTTDALKSDVLNSLSEIDVDYARDTKSVLSSPLPPPIPDHKDDFDDGDLKFKSQRIIYAPTKALGSGDSNSHLRLASDGHVPSLVMLCANVLRKNISQVDHVGHLPWFIFEKALKDASVKDLIRIEKTNPQFVKNMHGFFDKYAQRDFPHVNWEKLKRDFPKKPHGQLYQKLVVETENRLNSIINRTAHKVKEVRDAQRSVQTTSVILPKSVQRARQNVFPGQARPRKVGERSGSHPQSLPFVTPRNMSYGETISRNSSCASNNAGSSSKSTTSGGLMNQLKRKFVNNSQKPSKLSKF
ncbi:Elongin-A [Cichlidogyrus casuarinus]|uniref:Elongin-A n=1 Tax=Cichlidogyrus casuarinus TaxID=1844966 RepID=A0ABD2QPL6_9PLAT